MSTRTDWGYFDKDGKPVAVADAWWKWVCPNREWVPAGYEHYVTGEWIDEGMTQKECKLDFVRAKLDKCKKCGMEFRYP